jgi:DNA-binding transcriptional MerR regulator
MADARNEPAEAMTEDLWAMGSVVRRTGITEHSLRAWEKRFGFPNPIRLPSGHRRYTPEDVQRLQMIASAIELGYRAGDVVRAHPDRLAELIGRSVRPVTPSVNIEEPGKWIERILEASLRFDRHQAASDIRHLAASMGILAFLNQCVVPLLTEVGERWIRGELDVRHEHFMSELLDDELRSLRRSLEHDRGRSSIVLAGLPEEQHSLGLQMVALLAASAGVRPHLLGARVPVEDIAATAHTTAADVVGVTISGTVAMELTEKQVGALRRRLPDASELWLGGAGAPAVRRLPEAVVVLDSLDDTASALADLK